MSEKGIRRITFVVLRKVSNFVLMKMNELMRSQTSILYNPLISIIPGTGSTCYRLCFRFCQTAEF